MRHITFRTWKILHVLGMTGIYASVFVLYAILDPSYWFGPFTFAGIFPMVYRILSDKKRYQKSRFARDSFLIQFEKQFDKDIKTIRKSHYGCYPNVSDLQEYMSSRGWDYTGHHKSSRHIPSGWTGLKEETTEVYTWDRTFTDFEVWAICKPGDNGAWLDTEKHRVNKK